MQGRDHENIPGTWLAPLSDKEKGTGKGSWTLAVGLGGMTPPPRWSMCPSVRGSPLLPTSASFGPTFWSCPYLLLPLWCPEFLHPSTSHSRVLLQVLFIHGCFTSGLWNSRPGHLEIRLWLTKRDTRQGLPIAGPALGVTHSRRPSAMGFPGLGTSRRHFCSKQGPGTPLGSQCHFAWMPQESVPAVTTSREESGMWNCQSALQRLGQQ